MFQASVKLSRPLSQRVRQAAEKAGYASPEEFVEHVLERELARLEDAGAKDAIVEKLKGLGYIE